MRYANLSLGETFFRSKLTPGKRDASFPAIPRPRWLGSGPATLRSFALINVRHCRLDLPLKKKNILFIFLINDRYKNKVPRIIYRVYRNSQNS